MLAATTEVDHMAERVAPPRVLIVDDSTESVSLYGALLEADGYLCLAATTGEMALTLVDTDKPDLILLDLMLPGLDGLEVCRQLRARDTTRFLPIIVMTASGSEERVAALKAGADDFLTKPAEYPELLARVRSLVRIKRYHDQIERQAEELEALNRDLVSRVNDQVAEITRLSRLQRFLPRHVAGLITSDDERWLFDTHRQNVAVVVCTLQGFTEFTLSAEPEDVIGVLRDFHSRTGDVVRTFDSVVGWVSGHAVMAFLNDPVPCPSPPTSALDLAESLSRSIAEGLSPWVQEGYSLSFGIGVAIGYATMGVFGSDDRLVYGPVGSVVNLAARLSERASSSEILISQSLHATLPDLRRVEPVQPLDLEGFPGPVRAWRVGPNPPSSITNAPASAARAQSSELLPLPTGRPSSDSGDRNSFRREGGDWQLSYLGSSVRVRDTKGLTYLAALLATPGRELHVADMVHLRSDASDAGDEPDIGPTQPSDRNSAETLLAQLESARDEAREWGDLERAARVEEQMRFVNDGLPGAQAEKQAPDESHDNERARKAVTNRIRQSVTKISETLPDLGRHLGNSVRTGTYCSYQPESPVEWEL